MSAECQNFFTFFNCHYVELMSSYGFTKPINSILRHEKKILVKSRQKGLNKPLYLNKKCLHLTFFASIRQILLHTTNIALILPVV